MGLLQLPSELLLIIAEHTLPYSFESLSLTCKQLYNGTALMRQRHNGLRKQYRNFSFTDSVAKVSDLLVEIAADPIIAAYIVHLDLSSCQHCEDGEMDNEYIESMNCKLGPLVFRSPHLSTLSDGQDGLHERWLREIVHDVEFDRKEDPGAEFCVAFFASLLINVETLIMPDRWCNYEIMEHDSTPHNPVIALLQLLVMNANDKGLSNQPLQKLHTIHPTGTIDTQSGTVMEVLLPFLALDSLRELHHWCASLFIDYHAIMPFPTLGRNLEVMRLEDYVISGGAAATLFRHMQNLRVFEMEYSMKDEIGYGFQADEFMRSLIAGTCGSLEKLVLIGSQVWPDTQALNCSLRGFSRLKHLELSTLFLVNGAGALGTGFGEEGCETEVEESSDEEDEIWEDEGGEEDQECDEAEGENGEDEGEENASDRGEEDVEDAEAACDEQGGQVEIMDDESGSAHDDEESFPDGAMRMVYGDDTYRDILDGDFHPDDYEKKYQNGDTVWRLVSALPKSLETLVIHTPAAPRNSACVERMFWKFEELRAERLPNLKQIEVHVRVRDCWGKLLDDHDDEVARLRGFFADKDILAKFEVYDDIVHWINRDKPIWW